MNEIKPGIITFNKDTDPLISAYETIPWKVNEYRDVEFFPEKITRVFLVSNQKAELESLLQQLETNVDDSHLTSEGESAIAIDLEWEFEKLCLIQFCANNICVIVRLYTKEEISNESEAKLIEQNDAVISTFLNSHKFYGKGMHNDKKMLLSYFGSTFSRNLEDISKTRLAAYNYSQNFNQMTLQFAGKPTSDFKVIEMTKSDWSLPELSFRQVLYAAFDTVALFYCYPNFPPMKTDFDFKNQKQKSNFDTENNQPKIKQKQNIRYFKTACQPNEDSGDGNKKAKKKSNKKVPKMNLSVVFKKREKKETFSYLITNYTGTKNKIILRTLFADLDFISYFNTEKTSMLFISSFSPIEDFSNIFHSQKAHLTSSSDEGNQNAFINKHRHAQKLIEIREPDLPMSSNGIEKLLDNVYLLPNVPFELCNDSDILFISNIPNSIFSDEKIQELFYCFGFDQIVSKIDDKKLNSCIVEPRNDETSKRLRTFIPFLVIDDIKLKIYEYPTFLSSIKMSNIPNNFTSEDLKELFIRNPEEAQKLDRNSDDYLNKLNQMTMIESCEFVLRRIETDSRTAYIILKSLEEKEFSMAKFNHYKLENLDSIPRFANYTKSNDDELLVIPFTSDVHIRHIRSFELNVYIKDKNIVFDDIFKEFSKFGKILQMNFDKRFNIYHIQYYRKCDALKAHKYFSDKNSSDKDSCNDGISDNFVDKVITEMHPDGSIVIVRDLPMEAKEENIISLFSDYGRITNLVFRDLTPMNILSVVDIFFSKPEEASEVKKSMNKFKVEGSFIHVSIRSREDITDWKMSQRNQWVIFDESYKTIYDIISKTEQFGKIIDYTNYKDHFLAMFDNQDNAKIVIDELNLSYPTYKQFVEETNNSKYLEIIQKPSIPGNPTGPKESVLVVDPVSNNLTEDFIEKIFCEGNATSEEEASSIVLASSMILPPLKEIIKSSSSKNSSSQQQPSECEYPHELFIVDSMKFKGMKRLIVYTPSNNVTKKLYTLLVNSEFEGKYFKPKKVDYQDLENPPPKNNNKIVFEGHVVTNPVVIIDPLPNSFNEKEIRETINDLPTFEMVICNSSIIPGRLRAVLMPKLASERRIMLKALSQKIIENGNLHVYKYKCDSIPPSL